MRPDGLTAVYLVDGLKDRRATVNRKTGELWINKDVWRSMTPPQRMFMLLHEMGHVRLQSTDEEAVDAWAFNQYVGLGYGLKDSVRAMTGQLDDRNPAHRRRATLQLHRALKHERKQRKMDVNHPLEGIGNDQAIRDYDRTLDIPQFYKALELWGEITSFTGPEDRRRLIEKLRKNRRNNEELRIAVRQELQRRQKVMNRNKNKIREQLREFKKRDTGIRFPFRPVKQSPGRPMKPITTVLPGPIVSAPRYIPTNVEPEKETWG